MAAERSSIWQRGDRDYDEALRLKPNQPYSLYGRGLAKQKKGDAAGDADMAAARAIQRDIAEKFHGFGVQVP